MSSSPTACPVPSEQQPLNEYQDLKGSWFSSWAALSLRRYLMILAWIWLPSWLVCGPIAAASFAPLQHPIQFFLSAGAGASFLLFLVVLRLYLGWSYIRNRLTRATIPYEESGWYDGQHWTKPPEVLVRDRLIVGYQVNPILRRLQRTVVVIALIFLLEGLTWSTLSFGGLF